MYPSISASRSEVGVPRPVTFISFRPVATPAYEPPVDHLVDMRGARDHRVGGDDMLDHSSRPAHPPYPGGRRAPEGTAKTRLRSGGRAGSSARGQRTTPPRRPAAVDEIVRRPARKSPRQIRGPCCQLDAQSGIEGGMP